MNNKVKVGKKEFVCNIDGAIYDVEFDRKLDFDIGIYNGFIEIIRKSGVDIFLKNFMGISVEYLIDSFDNLDVENLNLLYCNCMLIDTVDSHNISDLLLSYFELFIDCKKELFCSKDDADIYVRVSRFSMFGDKDCAVIDKINSSIKLDIIKYINDNHRLERRFRLKRKSLLDDNIS